MKNLLLKTTRFHRILLVNLSQEWREVARCLLFHILLEHENHSFRIPYRSELLVPHLHLRRILTVYICTIFILSVSRAVQCMKFSIGNDFYRLVRVDLKRMFDISLVRREIFFFQWDYMNSSKYRITLMCRPNETQSVNKSLRPNTRIYFKDECSDGEVWSSGWVVNKSWKIFV